MKKWVIIIIILLIVVAILGSFIFSGLGGDKTEAGGTNANESTKELSGGEKANEKALTNPPSLPE